MLAVLLVVGGFGGWATFAQISAAVVSSGRIEVEESRQVVQHLDGGVVKEIRVKEGDTVAAGDLLIQLDPTDLQSQLAVTEGQLFEALARIARMKAEEAGADTLSFDPLLDPAKPMVKELMDGQTQLFLARQNSDAQMRDQLQKRRDELQSQISGIEAQQAAVAKQIELVSNELEGQKSLFGRGLTTLAKVNDLEMNLASLSGRSGELIASKAEIENKITETDIQILGVATQRREQAITQLRDMNTSAMRLAEQRRALLNQLDRLDIRAPMAGVVYDMQVVAPRSVIKAAEPVLYIVPQDRPLVVSAKVSSRDVDQIYVGQNVTLRFSSFDRRITPVLEGKVDRISADAFLEPGTQVAYYKIQVSLLPGQETRLPEGETLKPGMPVEAFIATGARSPLEYFVRPMAEYFTKVFRET